MTLEEFAARHYIALKMREAADLLEAGQIQEFSVQVDNEQAPVPGAPGMVVERRFTGWKTVTIVLRAREGALLGIEPQAPPRLPQVP
jgi:hypothetical protein